MFGERFKIRGHALDDPEIGRAADHLGGRAGLLEQLVHGLVVERAGVLVVAGEEVGFAIGVEINAERIGDARLAAAEGVGVFVAIAVIVDAERPGLPAGLRARRRKAAALRAPADRSPQTIAARSGAIVRGAQPVRRLRPGCDWSVTRKWSVRTCQPFLISACRSASTSADTQRPPASRSPAS